MTRPASSLGDKVSVVILSRTATTAIDTFTGIALLHLLSQESMGILALLFIIYEVSKQVATFGFPESVFYFFERLPPGTRRAFARQTFRITTGAAIFVAALIVSSSYLTPWWLADWSPSSREAVRAYLPVLALVAVLEIPTWPVQNILLALNHERYAGSFQLGTSLVTLGCLVGPVAAGMGIGASIHALLVSSTLRLATSWILMVRLLPPERDPLPPGTFREQVRFAVPLGFHTLASRLNKYIDKIIVSVLASEALLAQYQAAAYEIPFIAAIPYGMGAVLISRYAALQAAGQRDELVALWYRGIQKVTLAVVPTAVWAIAVAPDLVLLAAGGEAYARAIVPFQLFCLALLLRVAQFGAMLQAVGDTARILRITALTLAFNLVLSIPLTMTMGLVGTALGTVIASLFGWILNLRAIARHLGLGFSRVLPWWHYARASMVSAVAGAAAWLGRSLVFPAAERGEGLLLATAIFAGTLASLAWSTGTVTRDDLRSLAVLLRLRRGAR